jgi:hypothetical protein
MQSRVLGLVAACLGLCAPSASADYLSVLATTCIVTVAAAAWFTTA